MNKTPSWKSRILIWLRNAIIIFVLFCGLILILQNGMIFHHVMDQRSREFLQNLPEFYEVEFVSDEGRTHHGVMRLTSDEVAPLIIYFGGNGEVSYSHMRARELLGHWSYFSDFHYLFIDYEGYGLNDGRTNYRNMQTTALAAYEYAIHHPYVDSEQIVVMGFSLGTASAVYLGAHRPVAGLILLTPYANGYDLYNNLLPIFHGPMRLLVRQKLPSEEFAPMASGPVLIIASREDEIIPFASSEELATLFPNEVDFMELQGARHNDVFQWFGVLERIEEFLSVL